MVFIAGQNEVKLDEESHVYTRNGERLTSVSRLIHNYTNEFDEDGVITARCAARNGLTVEEQKAEWRKINEDSIIRGHSFHDDLETYIKTKKVPDINNQEIIKQFSKIKFDGLLYSEVRLWHNQYKIAGTSDIIELLPDNSLNIWDLKSNKKITGYSWGRKMLYPLNHIWDANLYHYTIQLQLYKFMLEEAGWWVRNMTILFIDPKKNKLKQIPINGCRDDVIMMLEHYQKNYQLINK